MKVIDRCKIGKYYKTKHDGIVQITAIEPDPLLPTRIFVFYVYVFPKQLYNFQEKWSYPNDQVEVDEAFLEELSEEEILIYRMSEE
jgi:hypothetical protein